MHAQQKVAWFNLAVTLGSVVLYAMAVPFLSWRLGRPIASVAAPALGIFGLCGLTGFAVLFYRPRRDGKPAIDERDHLLASRAWQFGMAIFWVTFVAACMGSWALMRYGLGMAKVTVPVELFPGIAFAAWIIEMVAQSVATLHFYGWRSNNAAEQ